METIQSLTPWHWLVLAIALAVIELIAPLVFFIWMSLAAMVIALILFVAPLGWEAQFITFAVLSVAFVLIGRKFYSAGDIPSQEPLLNKLDQQYIGRSVTLSQPVVDGRGEIIINDTRWKISGQDCPVGTRITLIASTDGVFNYEIAK